VRHEGVAVPPGQANWQTVRARAWRSYPGSMARASLKCPDPAERSWWPSLPLYRADELAIDRGEAEA